MLRVADYFADSDTGPPAPGQRGRLLRARAGVRGRRRDGRRAGRRGGLAHRGRDVRRGPARRRRAPRSAWRGCAAEANDAHPRGRAEDEQRAGMGTTLTAAYVDEDELVVRATSATRRAYLLPRRRAAAAHRRPLARRGDGPPRQADRRGGRGAPAALDHHPRARPRARRRGRPHDHVGARRRRVPALPRRADVDDRRGRDRGDPARRGPTWRRRPRAGRRRQRRRAGATTSRWSCSGSRRSAVAARRDERRRSRPRSAAAPRTCAPRRRDRRPPLATAAAAAGAAAARPRRAAPRAPRAGAPRAAAAAPPPAPAPRRLRSCWSPWSLIVAVLVVGGVPGQSQAVYFVGTDDRRAS